MTREKFEKLKKFIDENNLEEKIDKAFCELNDLICLGSNDEGQTNYNLDEYWNFVYAFVSGYNQINEKMKKYIKACWHEESLNDYSSYVTNTSDEFRDLVERIRND